VSARDGSPLSSNTESSRILPFNDRLPRYITHWNSVLTSRPILIHYLKVPQLSSMRPANEFLTLTDNSSNPLHLSQTFGFAPQI